MSVLHSDHMPGVRSTGASIKRDPAVKVMTPISYIIHRITADVNGTSNDLLIRVEK